MISDLRCIYKIPAGLHGTMMGFIKTNYKKYATVYLLVQRLYSNSTKLYHFCQNIFPLLLKKILKTPLLTAWQKPTKLV